MNCKLLCFAFIFLTIHAYGAYSPELLAKAESGDSSAQAELALCYMQGDDIAKNEAEAMKWYRKAAEQGDAEAQKVIDADQVKRKRWLRWYK